MNTMPQNQNLRIVQCCATCKHWAGWLDNMWCKKYGDVEIKPYWLCDGFEMQLSKENEIRKSK